MATKPTQATRIAALATPLGTDVLLLTRLEGAEGISELFEFRIDALSEKPNLDFKAAIGANCCVSIKDYGGPQRHINGVLAAAQWTGMSDKLYSYRLVLRPWLWMLSRSGGCRMFKDMTVREIIADVFGKHADFAKADSSKLGGSYPKFKYCVQYRESDLNFVSRLMEANGIYYYFRHSEQEHTLVLADDANDHDEKPTGANLIYRPITGGQRRKEEHLFNWFTERTFNTGKIVLKDYDYMEPGNELLTERMQGGGYKNDKLEMFDYPGKYKDSGLGSDYAKFRLEAEQAADRRCQATGDALNCIPGYVCNLREHPEPGQNIRYLILRATHTFVSDSYRSTGQLQAGEIYTGHYEFLPSSIPFRAPMITPRPVIHGPQTAVVVSGTDGENELDVDSDGCIRVQFHWDRDKQVSRLVRVAQIWSGNGWGGIVIPRVGQEVIVQFIEGDPDRPMVIGTVYNRKNPVPYPLPADKKTSGVKSKSLGGDGYNEFVFDDKSGSELIRMHAQKDLGATIENDEKRDIGNDIKTTIGNDEERDVGNTLKIKAGMLIELTVGGSKIKMEPKGITITAPTITVTADVKLTATANLTEVKGNATLILQGGVVKIN